MTTTPKQAAEIICGLAEKFTAALAAGDTKAANRLANAIGRALRQYATELEEWNKSVEAEDAEQP